MKGGDIVNRCHDDKWENTWIAWRRMFLDWEERCEFMEDYIWLMGKILGMIWSRVECILVGHEEVDWVSLADPGWVGVYCKKCRILLHMEERN